MAMTDRWIPEETSSIFLMFAGFYISSTLICLPVMSKFPHIRGFARSEFQSGVIGFFHSMWALFLASQILSSDYTNEAPLTPTGKAMMMNSLVYLTVDGVIMRSSNDIAMALHHWLGMPVFFLGLYENYGAGFYAAGLLLAEPTAPIFNMKLLLELIYQKRTFIVTIHEAFFGLFFIILRTVPYYKVLLTVWSFPNISIFIGLLFSINVTVSAYWSYIVLCKFLKEFTRKDGKNFFLIDMLNAIKNFTSKSPIGKTLLFSAIFYYGMISPHVTISQFAGKLIQ